MFCCIHRVQSVSHTQSHACYCCFADLTSGKLLLSAKQERGGVRCIRYAYIPRTHGTPHFLHTFKQICKHTLSSSYSHTHTPPLSVCHSILPSKEASNFRFGEILLLLLLIPLLLSLPLLLLLVWCSSVSMVVVVEEEAGEVILSPSSTDTSPLATTPLWVSLLLLLLLVVSKSRFVSRLLEVRSGDALRLAFMLARSCVSWDGPKWVSVGAGQYVVECMNKGSGWVCVCGERWLLRERSVNSDWHCFDMTWSRVSE